VEFEFKYDGLGMGTLAFNNMSGIGQSGTGVLKVDGKVVTEQKMERTLPLILQWDENLDVGSDTGTPVDDRDYQVPFAFTARSTRSRSRSTGRSFRRMTSRSSKRRRGTTRPANSSACRNRGMGSPTAQPLCAVCHWLCQCDLIQVLRARE